MTGAITVYDLLAHPAITIGSFGWRLYVRALFSAHDETFLSLLCRTGAFGPAGDETARACLPPVLERCAHLEYGVMRIYDRLAHRFSDTPAVNILFAHLAEQEREHGELLEICARAVEPGAWQEGLLERLGECLEPIEAKIAEVRRSLGEVHTVDDALRLIVQLESSEVNRIFEEIVTSAESPFVKKLQPFRRSVRRHIVFICRQVPRIAPQLAPACEELRAVLLG